MREKVVIIGGGVAGLTAAHELIERDYEVQVFERRAAVGGKAASGRVTEAKIPNLPSEHGFRFIPGWYRHLRDTLKRIPFKGKRAYFEGASVHDNLVGIPNSLLTWSNRDSVVLPLRTPRGLNDLNTLVNLVREFQGLGLTADDVTLFFTRLSSILILPDLERERRFENVSFWEYFDCSSRSSAYQDFIRATTRTLIAAKAEEVSAYTMARLAARTFGDSLTEVDSVFNGPTSEAWLEPWRQHLAERGVDFRLGRELDSITLSDATGDIESVSFEEFAVAQARRLVRALVSADYNLSVIHPAGGYLQPERDAALAQVKDDRATIESLLSYLRDQPEFQAAIRKQEQRIREEKNGEQKLHDTEQLIKHLDAAADPARNAALPEEEQAAAHSGAITEWRDSSEALREVAQAFVDDHPDEIVRADHFVFALPLEQMSYYVKRSPALRSAAAELSSLPALASHMDWMAGIQFFLSEKVDLERVYGTKVGHIVCLDSDWALTAIVQTTFWHDVSWPADIKAILSVDIANWHKKGRFLSKEPFNSHAGEIAQEVWDELKIQLNGRFDILNRYKGYHLDDSIVDINDRSKQAFYEKARAAALEPGAADPAPGIVKGARNEATGQIDAYEWGPHLLYNVEPILINHVGTRQLRPRAVTSIRNMFLAADYVLTETDLACMEGANEAARLAVNAILAATASDHRPCQLWNLDIPAVFGSGALGTMVPRAILATKDGVTTAIRDVGNRLLSSIGRELVRHREKTLQGD